MPRLPPEFAGHFLPFPARPEYRAVCTYVVDGDTFDALVDLGFNDYRYITVRLLGVDTPELNSSDPEERSKAQMAKMYTAGLILGKHLALVTYKDTQTFGRYVAEVYFMEDGVRVSLADALTEAGFQTLK